MNNDSSDVEKDPGTINHPGGGGSPPGMNDPGNEDPGSLVEDVVNPQEPEVAPDDPDIEGVDGSGQPS
ncbi:hypothetical protein [Pseudomonas sp. RIT-PI-AD]|uniref:hypothetical protein n=1 Tax=Pseudomonas sp. RIT-PI-AD TaxID=3035294 RepID=UPI0021D9F074|nr:hypothetical protein [Pseudomonas sp. RIT-PI-AD]